jgi:hypothetical protein
MSRTTIRIALYTAVLLPQLALATPVVLHSDTFETGDTQTWTNCCSSFPPELAGPTGAMTSNSLWMYANDGIKYTIPDAYRTGEYYVSFDLAASNLLSSFQIFLDTSSVQVLEFGGNGDIEYYVTDPYSDDRQDGVLGSFNLNELLHVEYRFSIPSSTWNISVNGNEIYAGLMYDSGVFRTMRFAGSGMYLDNVYIAAVPVPAAAWLFGSALVGLGWMRRKKV